MMSDPKVHQPPPTPRRGKRIMWALLLLVLLSLGYAGYMLSERSPETPNPGMSREGRGMAR